MQIFVNIEGGKIIALEVSPMDTIDNIKVKIKDKEGLPLDSYTLQYDKKDVEEGRTLNDYDIRNESTLYLKGVQGTNKECWLMTNTYMCLIRLHLDWVNVLNPPPSPPLGTHAQSV